MSLVAAEAIDCLHGGPGLLRSAVAWCQAAAGSYRLMSADADVFTLVDAGLFYKEVFSIKASGVISSLVLTNSARRRGVGVSAGSP